MARPIPDALRDLLYAIREAQYILYTPPGVPAVEITKKEARHLCRRHWNIILGIQRTQRLDLVPQPSSADDEIGRTRSPAAAASEQKPLPIAAGAH